MKLKIVTGDLFEFCDKEDRFPVHCISADKAMGAGIAAPMNWKYNLKQGMQFIEPVVGDCLFINGVFNLITKHRYYDKPTYYSFNAALTKCVDLCKNLNIKKIAMPKIGCGLDKLDWNIVFKSINEKFAPLNIDIKIVLKK